MHSLILQRTALIAQSRWISTSVALLKNHYEALEIPTNATQNEIKTAYYKLSKLYHPDKNKGSDLAAEKFREVTAAYEVLGNFRLRKLYDKGILHTAGAEYAAEMQHEVEVEDDAQTKFYKQRMKRTEAPSETGQQPIYDLDNWSREHYSRSFSKKQNAKAVNERRMAKEAAARDSLKIDRIIFLFMGLIFFFVWKSMSFKEEADTPKTLPPKS